LTHGPLDSDFFKMKPSRLIALALMMTTAAAAPAQTAPAAPPAATVQGLCDALISAMQQGPALGFAGRRQLLEPQIRRAIDLPLMTRLVLGPPWRGLAPEVQRQLVDAFSDYSISTYANRFSGYSGEKFIVDPAPTRLESGDVIVHTKLVTKDPDPVRLDYLMRSSGGTWKIIDVYLSGTISELAARRSEFSAVLRQGGAAALVEMLKKKAAELSN
jgi:phospholipid transport system substrate-binding protein